MDYPNELSPQNLFEYTITGQNYDTQDPDRPVVRLMLNPTPQMDNAIATSKVRIIANELRDKKILIGRAAQEQGGIKLDPSILSSGVDSNTKVSRDHGECRFESNAQGGQWIWDDHSKNGTSVYEPVVLQYEEDRLQYSQIAVLNKQDTRHPSHVRVFQGTVLCIASDMKDNPDSAIWLRFHSPNYNVGRNERPTRNTDKEILVVERITGLDAAMEPELEELVRRYSPLVVEPSQDF